MKKINKTDFKIYGLATFTIIAIIVTLVLAGVNSRQSSSRDSIINELNNKYIYMGSDDYKYFTNIEGIDEVIEEAYGSDFESLDKNSIYYDRLNFTVSDSNNKFKLTLDPKEQVINKVSLKATNVDFCTDIIKVRSTSSFGYESVEKTSNLVDDKVVEYYGFGGIKFDANSEISNYESKMISGFDIVYDKSTYNTGDILSDYKIIKVYYANGETEGDDVTIIRNEDTERVEIDPEHDHEVSVASESEIATGSEIKEASDVPDEHDVKDKYTEFINEIKGTK